MTKKIISQKKSETMKKVILIESPFFTVKEYSAIYHLLMYITQKIDYENDIEALRDKENINAVFNTIKSKVYDDLHVDVSLHTSKDSYWMKYTLYRELKALATFISGKETLYGDMLDIVFDPEKSASLVEFSDYIRKFDSDYDRKFTDSLSDSKITILWGPVNTKSKDIINALNSSDEYNFQSLYIRKPEVEYTPSLDMYNYVVEQADIKFTLLAVLRMFLHFKGTVDSNVQMT